MKIKKGTTRLVFIVNNWAIKVPNFTYSLENFLKGWLANITERNIWNVVGIKGVYEQEIKDTLCPVRYSLFGSFFIIMPKVKILPFIPYWEPPGYMEEICSDHKSENYGYLEDKLVCIDYGQ